MHSNTGTLNNHHFLFGTNGKVVVLGVPILKHFRVSPIFIVSSHFLHFPIHSTVVHDSSLLSVLVSYVNLYI